MRRRLSYSNVTATIALFVALGGTGYAAITLPANSVTTKQVKNGTLLAKDFKKGQLNGGRQGAGGTPGAPGAPGQLGTTGPAGAVGTTGLPGAAGTDGLQGLDGGAGLDGSAKVYAYITGQGNVAAGSHGITDANITTDLVNQHSQYCIDGLPFTPRVALVQPDVLSGGSFPRAEVQTPSDNTGTCGSAQVYIRLSESGVAGSNFANVHLTSTGYAQASAHGFYIEIN